MKDLVAALIGALFAVGLGLSGMTDATKVIGFLDLSAGWDPSLGLVMAGGIGAHWLSWRYAVTDGQPLFGDAFHLPTRTDIDFRLVGGAALFGTGWALGGFCPGPGIVSGTTGDVPVLTFLLGMSLGMLVWKLVPLPADKPTPLTTTEPTS